MKILSIIALGVLFTFTPNLLPFIEVLSGEAYAWGPATHLELSRTILSNLSALPQTVKTLLEEYPYDYHYGNIGADIVVGKNYVDELNHCHNWSFGFKLLDDAQTDSQRAFAYGYLTHLAADTVAHNHFIPTKIIKTFTTNMHRHIYWEVRFDSFVDESIWDIPEKISQEIHKGNDELLSKTLEGTGTPLPFGANKTLFSSLINLNRINQMRNMVKFVSKLSVWEFGKDDKDRYFNHAYDAAIGFLIHGETAPCTEKDPTGKVNLKLATDTRNELRSLKKKGMEWDKLYNENLNKVLIV